MDKDVIKSNLKALREMVLDENKIVTYISISKELCIHVNEGKSLLCNLLKDNKNNHPDTALYVTYVVSGLLNNNNAATTVCPEADVNSVRKTFKTIFYEHVYSVSQGLKSADNVALTLLNKFEDLSLCTGLIKNNYCTKRSLDEIGNLKSTSQKSVSESKPTVSNVSKEKLKAPLKTEHGDVKKVHETKSDPHIKTEVRSPNKNTLGHKTPNKKNGKVGTKNIAGFFNKANSAPTIKTDKPFKESKQDNKHESKAINMIIKAEIDENIKTEKEANIKAVKEENIKNIKAKKDVAYKSEAKNTANIVTKDKATKETKGDSLSQIKKNAKVDKKRKRVLYVCDSDSDNETNDPFVDEMAVDHESEDEIPPTPTVSTVKITSGIVNPKKRRKVVDKTYTDDDGYILTKKEEVYESCSDNEEVAIKENVGNKNDVTKESPDTKKVTQIKSEVSPKNKGGMKKVSPPQKGKQPTMMNFFKKV